MTSQPLFKAISFGSWLFPALPTEAGHFDLITRLVADAVLTEADIEHGVDDDTLEFLSGGRARLSDWFAPTYRAEDFSALRGRLQTLTQDGATPSAAQAYQS